MDMFSQKQADIRKNKIINKYRFFFFLSGHGNSIYKIYIRVNIFL